MFCFIFYGDINFENKISLSTWLFGKFMIYFIMILATHLVLSDKGLKPRLNYQFIRIWTITFVEYPFTMNSRGTIARDWCIGSSISYLSLENQLILLTLLYQILRVSSVMIANSIRSQLLITYCNGFEPFCRFFKNFGHPRGKYIVEIINNNFFCHNVKFR